jgi:hypothetical protein
MTSRAQAVPPAARIIRASVDFLLVVLPAFFLFNVLFNIVRTVGPGWKTKPWIPLDFRSFWRDGRHYLHGQSPYHASFAHTSVYPAPVAALFAPFAMVPFHVAVGIFAATSTLAVAGSLWLFGVRDWRCYAAVLLSPAVLTAITVGTLTPLLLFGLAATWKLRERRSVAVPVALLIVGKLIFWPILVWLFFTGRRRASVEAVVLAFAVALLGWVPIGFADITRYPTILEHLGAGYGPKSYAIISLIGAGRATDVAVAAAAVVILWALRQSDERRLFSFAVLATLACSPIVWLHYFAFLVAVAAVIQPRFGLLWLAPALLWLTPHQMIGGDRWRVFLVIAVCALMLLLSRSSPNLDRADLPTAVPAD